MKRLLKISVVFAFFLVSLNPLSAIADETKKQTVSERILEILIQNHIITKEQYDDLKRQAQEEESVEKPKAVAGFDRGFYIESADKESKIRFDGRLQVDSRWFLGNTPNNDSFYVRRARLAASGTFYKYYDFRIEYEAGKSPSSSSTATARLNDGYMSVHYIPEAQFRIGQFKVPFLMEELQSDNWIYFIERSLADGLAPSRDIGAMFYGPLLGDQIYYELGVFNGTKLNELDADNGKDVAFRLVVAPFKNTGSWFIEGLHVGGAVTYGQEDLETGDWWNSGKFSTSAGTTYLQVADVVQDGARTRENAELYWNWGSTVLMAEYVNVSLDGMEQNGLKRDFNFQGGYLTISHFLTGEKFFFKKGIPGGVYPVRRFKLGGEGWGAWQIGARADFLKTDKDLLELGYAKSGGFYTDKTVGLTFGVNWYPNEMVRLMLNYNHVHFDDPVTDDRIDDEDVILTRFQVAL